MRQNARISTDGTERPWRAYADAIHPTWTDPDFWEMVARLMAAEERSAETQRARRAALRAEA